MTTALRSFLRYVRYSGDVTLDLAAAVPVVANWSMPSIPRAISADQTRQLLASIDRRTAVGRRSDFPAPHRCVAVRLDDGPLIVTTLHTDATPPDGWIGKRVTLEIAKHSDRMQHRATIIEL